MQLQFQYMHGITLTGEQPSAFHYRDQYVKLGWIDGAGDMRSMQADTPYGDWSSPSFSAHRSGVFAPAEDPNVDHLRMFSYSGVEHWVVWKRFLESHHRIAKYKYYVILLEQIVETVTSYIRVYILSPIRTTSIVNILTQRLIFLELIFGDGRGRNVIEIIYPGPDGWRDLINLMLRRTVEQTVIVIGGVRRARLKLLENLIEIYTRFCPLKLPMPRNPWCRKKIMPSRHAVRTRRVEKKC